MKRSKKLIEQQALDALDHFVFQDVILVQQTDQTAWYARINESDNTFCIAEGMPYKLRGNLEFATIAAVADIKVPGPKHFTGRGIVYKETVRRIWFNDEKV